MLKKYCRCGGVTEYGTSVPNYCQGCGKSFLETSSSVKVRVKIPQKIAAETEEIVNHELPQIDKWEIEAFENVGSRGETVGSLRPPSTQQEVPPRSKPKKMGKSMFRKQFKKEAGTLRND